jgi:DNA-binding MarR family transcriptional regulator
MDHVDRIFDQWGAERPDLDVAPMRTIGRLTRLSACLGKEMGRTFGEHGLSSSGFDVLATLRRSGAPYALSPGALMEATMVTSGTMTNRIDQLQKAGLVLRIRNAKDGRGFLIGLTEHGLAMINAAVTDHVATQHRLIAGLDASERAQLDALLKKFLKTFETPKS